MVIELSGVQFGLKSYAWFQNGSAQREFDLKSQVWFQTKIAGHEVQLPLYYIHFEIAQIQDLVKYFIDAVLSRFEIKFIPFPGEKLEFWKQNLQHDSLCLPFSCNLMGYFKQALKSDWLFFFFSVASLLAEKKMRFKAKIMRFVNKSHQLVPIRLQGPPLISKWV